MTAAPVRISRSRAKAIWLHAQRLDCDAPFGSGPAATPAAVWHLGYVQIDTIHVIERCHHHILYTRIPDYQREHLDRAQAVERSVFEFWTHALAYLPVEDFRHYTRDMRNGPRAHGRWFASVTAADLRRVLARIRRGGELTIRDIDDDVLVEKDHPWASRKPSKRALQLAFFRGLVTVSRRTGMVKSYELTTRHFGWERLPRSATQQETLDYAIERALRSQGLISLDSICYGGVAGRPAIRRLVEKKVRRGELIAVDFEGAGTCQHWAHPATLDREPEASPDRVHILSPFDPLVCQRKRLSLFFDYEHRFEAYLPAHRRVLGYFACPVLAGDRIVAALDLKTDRAKRRLRVQKWTWMVKRPPRALRAGIESALHPFERFQLAG
ncbi:MAG TPA: crosslink repair DNA glycosylase YcaQ family protein [Steroidobacteraceae bacterium]|nr:crosslink repair DNA glycosylase YcaQ family protein [Steroidobacteraceae bacterium]